MLSGLEQAGTEAGLLGATFQVHTCACPRTACVCQRAWQSMSFRVRQVCGVPIWGRMHVVIMSGTCGHPAQRVACPHVPRDQSWAERACLCRCVLEGHIQVPEEQPLAPAVKGFHPCNKPHFIPFLNCIIFA